MRLSGKKVKNQILFYTKAFLFTKLYSIYEPVHDIKYFTKFKQT